MARQVVPRSRDGGGRGAVSQAGTVLLVETVRRTGLDAALSAALAPWRKARAVHDPGKVLLDVALAVALGGDRLADVTMLRAEPAVFGPVASDPTVPRLVDTLAAGGIRALTALCAARAAVRESLEASLRRLKTDRVDLSWAHAPDYATPIEEIKRCLLRVCALVTRASGRRTPPGPADGPRPPPARESASRHRSAW
ncbi:aldo/keto reductase [Streptomyces prasinopilosus]|uniref:aldo/keto reductase n=1 Tax=Streptomyces prasinopilosus TaxID=67344 RepID=UPI003CC7C6B4